MLEPRQSIMPIPIENEMHKSYMAYAMSTLVARALPDVSDGLKPSQRRILVAMNDLNLRPNAKYRKCAKIAGDTSGNYHPHGEQIVYPTLYRMAQNFSLRYPLVDGQGNFGSIDGDPPAAMRYTEAKMTSAALEMLADLERDTVDLEPNYDETLMVPTVLPARFPNLLCNGATGIAVGMATNIPPHNLNEIVAAAIALVDDPSLEPDDLMEHVSGPDFPTGGIIYGVEGIRDAYRTGRGKIKIRARATIERLTNGRDGIIITEIPYMLNGTTLKEKIAEVARNKVVEGISDFRDESDRDGMRMVIELKRDAYPEVTLNQLYKHTPMESVFGIIMLALVEGQPRELSLKQMIQAFIDHRHEVITRRTHYDLDQARKRDHILQGLLIALQNLDEVIETIRSSPDSASAKAALIEKFELSDEQTDAILDMRLGRLTALEQDRIEAEHNELTIKISELVGILASVDLRMGVIKDELIEVRDRYGDERRTEILYSTGDFSIEDLVAEEDMVVTVSHLGYIKRLPLTTYRSQRRGGRGVAGMSTRDEDFVEHLFVASTHSDLLCMTTTGHCYRLKVYEVPQAGRAARGRPLVNLLEAAKDAKIAAVMPVKDYSNQMLAMVTQKGTIKKSTLESFSKVNRRGVIAIKTTPGDELVDVGITDGTLQIVIGTRNGQAIRFNEDEVRAMGRIARGVRGIRLKGDDQVVGMVIVRDAEHSLLTVCRNGYGKRSPIEDYRLSHRGGMGVINIKTTERNGPVIALKDVVDENELMIVTDSGVLIRCPIAQINTIGRNTQGVRLIKVGEGDVVRDVARLAIPEDGEEGDGAIENEAPENAIAEGAEGDDEQSDATDTEVDQEQPPDVNDGDTDDTEVPPSS